MSSGGSPRTIQQDFVRQEGVTLRTRSSWEFPLAAAISVVVSLFALGLVSGVQSEAEKEREQAFLDHKLQTLMLEVRALARNVGSVGELESWDDRGDMVPSLSMQKLDRDWLAPAGPFSGNRVIANQWLYARSLSIEPVSGVGRDALRMARMRMFRFEKNRGYVRVREARQLLAAGDAYQESGRVIDLYVLAVANSPLAWADPRTVRARLESGLLDLEMRNPGIRFRTHWITRLAYGRDRYYRPGPSVDGNPVAQESDPSEGPMDPLLAAGIADSNNHALRLLEERRLFERRVAAGLERAEEPTWRLLLQDLHDRPERYRDAVILNLHGGTLPMPPIRNYSDAARIPFQDPGLRVVCHPEKLRFARGRRGGLSEDILLRVYAWRSLDQDARVSKTPASAHPIVLRLPGVDLRPKQAQLRNGSTDVRGEGPRIRIEHVAGGRDASGQLQPYEAMSPAARWSGQAGSSGFELEYVEGVAEHEGYTEIRLHGTPDRCEAVAGKGLAASARLYGEEYIPLCIERQADFSRDLSVEGTGPKNTARWRIRIPAELLQQEMQDRQVLEVCTSIGEPVDDQGWNLSRTYAWWTREVEEVPLTERFQMMGDPRHNPYADLCDVGDSFPSGYNWWFDDFRHAGTNARREWPSLGQVPLSDGWLGRRSVDLSTLR